MPEQTAGVGRKPFLCKQEEVGPVPAHPPGLPHYHAPSGCIQRGSAQERRRYQSSLPLSLPSTAKSHLWAAKHLAVEVSGPRKHVLVPKAGCQLGVPSPALPWALCQGILKTQSWFQWTAVLELQEPLLAGSMSCCLPGPFHSPIMRGCVCPSVSHCAPSQGLGILLFVSTGNGLNSWLHSFYLPKESSWALTPGCLQSLSKTICVWSLQQQISQLRLKGNSMPSSF